MERLGSVAQKTTHISLMELKASMTPHQLRIFEKHVERISKLENSDMIEECLALHMLGYEKDVVLKRILSLTGGRGKEAFDADK